MKQKNNRIITISLYLILAVLIAQLAYTGYNYYKGPIWTAQSYIKALEKGDYAKAYRFLDKDSLDSAINEKQMIAYYKQVYDKHFVQAQMIGRLLLKGENTASCKVIYTFGNKNKEGVLQLVKHNNGWRIESPFKSSDVTIYAPAMSNVYINGKKVASQKDGVFVQQSLLPGNYMLQVAFPQTAYKDYYKVIKVPEQTEVVLPYDMVNVDIKTIKGMAVSLGRLDKTAGKEKVRFSDILPGEYALTIKSPYDSVEPIEETVKIGRQNCSLDCSDMGLSKKGEEMWKKFIDSFYSNYLSDIEKQETKHIAGYFGNHNRKAQLQLFKDWFIKDKNVKNAKLRIEAQKGKVNSQGCLQAELTEVIELTNLEEAEGKSQNRVYRIILKWDTQIDIMQENWQIVDRTLKESMIAYETEDGRWIQY